MSRLKKLAGETVIYGIGAVLPKIVGFLLVGSFLTYQMGKDLYGVYSILYAYVTLAMVIFTLRMETTFFKFASKENADSKHVFNSTLSLVLSSSGFLFLLLLLFNVDISMALLKSSDNARFILYFAGILFLDAIAAVPYARLRHENRPIKFSAIKIINSLITVAINLFCYKILPHIDALSSYYNEAYLLDYTFIANLIGSFLVVCLMYKELSSFKFRWDSSLIKQMLLFAWPLMIVGFTQAINQFADRILIERYTDSFGDAGLFSGAIKIAIIMNLFVTAFNYAVEPFFFKNASAEARKEIYGKIALVFTVCGVSIFLFVLFYLDILKHIISSDYHSALYVVPVALLANLALGLYYNFSIWYKLSGKTIYGALIASLGSVIFIVSSMLLIPSLGMIGASFSTLICFTFMCALAYYLGQKHFPIYYPIGRILGYILVGVVLFYSVDLMKLESSYKMLIGTVLIITFLFLAYRLDLKKVISS